MKSRSVRIRAVARPEDPDAVTVLRLAAAATDLDTLARMLLEKKEDEAAHGKRRYALRMTALHASEIKELVNHPDFDRVVRRCARRHRLAELPDAARKLREIINRGPLREVMSLARNGFAGHYDAASFADALAKVGPSELMDLPGQGCRHNVTDHLFDVALVEVSHSRYRREDAEKSLVAAINDVFDLQGSLIPVVQGLVAGLYAEAEGF